MNEPLVLVVMVVCNVDRFLAESIESILAQTLLDFEFIIVDFGSTDNSKSTVLKYAAKGSRIKFHQMPHCGLADARNAGCYLEQGKYIAVMDADDVSVPDRLSWETDFMEKHPDVSVLGGSVEWTDASGRVVAVWGNALGNREILVVPSIRRPRRTHSTYVGWRPAEIKAEAA